MWDNFILDTVKNERDLPYLLDSLFVQQRQTWPAFRNGEAALDLFVSKKLSLGESVITVQSNPQRKRSTYAKVDSASVAKRPCFLCPENIAPEERGVAFDDFVFLPNPFPILPRHLTIPVREHRPQRFSGAAQDMLRLAKALGPEMAIFYNGPQCGASAPDHFHFQAVGIGGIPFLGESHNYNLKEKIVQATRCNINYLIFQGQDPEVICENLYRTCEILSMMTSKEEPFLNIMARYIEGIFLVYFFPRSKHRPRVFFAPEESRIAISPACLEMVGIFVIAEPEHLDRVDESVALAVFQEVTLEKHLFNKLVEKLK